MEIAPNLIVIHPVAGVIPAACIEVPPIPVTAGAYRLVALDYDGPVCRPSLEFGGVYQPSSL